MQEYVEAIVKKIKKTKIISKILPAIFCNLSGQRCLQEFLNPGPQEFQKRILEVSFAVSSGIPSSVASAALLAMYLGFSPKIPTRAAVPSGVASAATP